MAASPTEFSTLSLHDALPISGDLLFPHLARVPPRHPVLSCRGGSIAILSTCRPTPPSGAATESLREPDRKSTRLNSSHVEISYAVFCLKKKNKNTSIICKYIS